MEKHSHWQHNYCQSCGYTKEDAQTNMDHHLCDNSGNAPWETESHKLTECILEPEQQLNKFQNTVWSEQADVQEAVLQKFDVRHKMAQLERQFEERDAEVSEWKSKYKGAKIAFNSACNAEKNILAEGRKAGLEEAADLAVGLNNSRHELAKLFRALANSETEKKG